MKFLVTGAAGFIGSSVSQCLLNTGHQVVGIDNLNNYYDSSLKKARLNRLINDNFTFYKLDLVNRESIATIFAQEKFDRVIHLAAQVGIRYSLENPYSYADTNLIGHLNILEGCRRNKVQHMLYASSSSVYGLNKKIPFSVDDSTDHPISFYAATKKANELMSHSYSHLYGLPTTGLRFFTVYGPWGRPDMALFKFTKAIIEGKTIDVYNNGKIKRNFTYIDDISNAIIQLQDIIPEANTNCNIDICSPAISSAPYRIYNISNNISITLTDCISVLEDIIGISANKNMMPMQSYDILETNADIKSLSQVINLKPHTSIRKGVRYFVEWYRKYYRV